MTNDNSKIFWGRVFGELTMTSIYEQDIYSNGNRSGIIVWHVVHHVPQNAKLQSVAERQNLVQEFCYLSEYRGNARRLSRTKRQRAQINTQILEYLH